MTWRRRGDAGVATALRALPVPAHADDFFDRLRVQLHAEADTLGGIPSTVIDLSVRRAARRPPRRRLQHAMTLATAPAVAAACFVLVIGAGLFARRTVDDRQRPSGAAAATARDFTAAKVQRLVVPRPYSPAKTVLRVKFHTTGVDRPYQSYDTVISPTGDYHVSRPEPALELNYSEATGSRTMYQGGDKGTQSQLLTQTDLPLGPPDGPEVSHPMGTLSRDLGAAVRAIAAERPGEVRKTVWNQRPALEHTASIGGGDYFETQDLTVDVETGITLQVKQTKADGTVVRTLVVDDIKEESADGAQLSPALPDAATAAPESKSFKSATLAQVAKAVPYRPLVPLWAPKGYYLAKVAYAPEVATVAYQTNPAYADVVALVYRNGFDSFTVTTRRAAPWSAPTSWTNPFLQGNPLEDLSTVDHVKAGVLAGDDLHVGIYPVVWPHVWAQHGDLVVTIAGDLTREQLLQITESLQAYVP